MVAFVNSSNRVVASPAPEHRFLGPVAAGDPNDDKSLQAADLEPGCLQGVKHRRGAVIDLGRAPSPPVS